jgi:hypothetical protein
VRLGAVVHIDDADPEDGTIHAHRLHFLARGGAPSSEDLAPGHVGVTAAVILGFSIATVLSASRCKTPSRLLTACTAQILLAQVLAERWPHVEILDALP